MLLINLRYFHGITSSGSGTSKLAAQIGSNLLQRLIMIVSGCRHAADMEHPDAECCE